jgi:hypothetical protein
LQQKLTQLEEAKEELLVRIEEEKLEKPKISAEFMTFWLHRFRKLDVTKESHRQMLIDTFVNAVYVYDDKLLLTFNFKDGTRTVTRNDVKTAIDKSGSDLDCLAAPRKGIPPTRGIPFLIAVPGPNPSKCNSPVGCCLPPARWRQHLNFCPKGKNANRSRPRASALPVAEKAEAQCVQRSARNEPASSGDVSAGHRKRTPAP